MGLSLDVYFRKQTYPSFPHFKSSFGWSSYNLKDLSINLFGDFRSAQIYHNLKAYIGAPDYTDEEIQAYLDKAIHGVYHINKDNNQQYDKETEAKLADIRLFISPDGAFLLKAHQALKSNIKKDQIAIFLEIPNQDIVSGNVMLVVAGDNAKKYAEEILRHKWTQDQYSLNDTQTKDLISALHSGQSLWDKVNDIALELKHTVEDLKSQIIIDVAGAISKFFGEKLRVDEKIWNIDHPEYLLQNDVVEKIKEKQQDAIAFFDSIGLDSEYKKVLNGLIEKGIQEIEDSEYSMQDSWAARCGFWNGLIDLISGIFDLIQLVNKGIKAHRNYKNNPIYYQALMLEYIDNLLQAAFQINWIEVLSHGWAKYKEFKEYVKEKLSLEYWQELLSFNHTEIAYYRGYLAFNILEAIIPPIKLAKLAKVGKLEKVIRSLDGLTTSATKTGVPAVKASDEVVGAFFRTIEQGTEVVKGGTKNINQHTDEVFDALKKQVDEVVEEAVSKRKKLLDDVETGKTKLDEDANGNKRKKGDETRSGNYAEIKVDDYFETQTFIIGKNKGTLKRISSTTVKTLDEPFAKGIDGIYEFSSPPPKYIISEVKYNTATLSKTITKSGGTQMSELWVDFDLRKGAVSPEIADDILIQGYEPLLCHVSKQGKVTVNTINQTLTEATEGNKWTGIISQ